MITINPNKVKVAPAITPVKAIEEHVAKYYSPMQQTMMKIWWDALPRPSVSLLSSIYAWLMKLTLLTDAGQLTDLPEAPCSIDAVYAECTALVKAAAEAEAAANATPAEPDPTDPTPAP